ncbi:MAG: 3-hydroxybutyryl-CoA dehydrogenase [Acidimicrobiia bacterium]|nr:3-hydroxybutyryl-CoA dehydrogenase [Acidimicrobiia bacterium]
MLMTIERVGIVGGGQMGAGIAEVCATAGVDVIVREINKEAASLGESRLRRSLERAVTKGKLPEEDRDAAIGRVRFTTDLEAMADRQLVIEAVVEHEPLKVEIFKALDNIVTSGEAIFASNTSSLPITRLATCTNRPDHVIGMHFFNPVPVMALMELITTVVTDPEVAAIAEEFATETLSKTVVKAKDRAGFVVNLLLVPYMTEAMRMYEAGHATAEDIDNGMKLGANHPMGPLELADFIGLDTMKLVADVLFEEYKLPHYAPPPLLVRMVEAGMLGRKTGRGFYEYPT